MAKQVQETPANLAFAGLIAPAFVALNSAAKAYDTARDTFAARMTEAFVTVLAADRGISAKTASKIVAEHCDYAKVSGTPSTLRSNNSQFFSETRHLRALHRAIPADLEGKAFRDAVTAYAKGLQVRAWIDKRSASRVAALKASKAETARETARQTDADKARDTAPGSTVQAVTPTVPGLQGEASRIIEALASMEGGLAALATLRLQIGAALYAANVTPLTASPRRRIRKAA